MFPLLSCITKQKKKNFILKIRLNLIYLSKPLPKSPSGCIAKSKVPIKGNEGV
jgi:hypothetical protein